MQTARRKFCLSIAGFDPSGGAGLLADIKTFEQCGVQGLGVCTALTFQTDVALEGVEWVSMQTILRQLNILLNRFTIDVVKIGLAKDLETLETVVRELKQKNKNIRIIWDPVVKSSSGFLFHEKMDSQLLLKILPQLYLITPNREEILKLGETGNAETVAEQLSKYCAVLLKGGHSTDSLKSDDMLFENGESTVISGERIIGKSKHGTGCVLSSAIASFLAHDFSLQESCDKAKGYIQSFINSSDDLLGWHHSIIHSETHA